MSASATTVEAQTPGTPKKNAQPITHTTGATTPRKMDKSSASLSDWMDWQ